MITQRQLQVLRLYAQGLQSKEIADKLCISIRTVESHLSGCRDALKARNSVHAVAIAITNGIIKLLIFISVFRAVFDCYSSHMRQPIRETTRIVRTVRPSRTKES